MLAPLKNRHLIEREPADSFELLEQACLRIAQLEGEKIALKLALRDLSGSSSPQNDRRRN